MLERLGVGAVVLAAIVPWSTWLAFGITTPTEDYLRASEFFVLAGAIGLAGAALAIADRWLGLFVALAAILALASRQNLFTAFVILVGAAALVSIRAAARAGWGPWLRHLLVATALLQALLALGQVFFWRPEWGEGVSPLYLSYGTIGNVKYLGCLLAVVIPLAPFWALPILGLGLVLSQSGIACLAALVGLLCRPMSWRWRIGTSVGAVGVLLTALMIRTLTLDTVWTRMGVWSIAFRDASLGEFVLGHGPSSWYWSVPAAQVAAAKAANAVNVELFHTAHSEPLQLLYEYGVAGAVLALAWVVSHRHAVWASPWRGAWVASALVALWLPMFHVPMVAPAAVAVLGITTAGARG